MKAKFERCFWQKHFHFGDNMFMGRFGGGWSWKIGICYAPGTLLFEFGVGMFRISWEIPNAGK